MAAEVEEIVCKFVGDFEVADNLRRNAEALCELNVANKKGAFNKLLVIQVGAIVEVSLAQIIYRAQNYNREGVPDIIEEDRQTIADTKVEKLNNIIQAMEKYKILNALGKDIYEELHKLRKYRNKVHIQDDLEIADASRNESVAFSAQVVEWAFKLASRVLNHLNEKYARPKDLDQYARTISLPKSGG